MEIKYLKTIQVFSKIAEVISMIVFICSIVGAVMCLIGAVTVGVLDAEWFKIGDVSIHGLFEMDNIPVDAAKVAMVQGLIVCLGEIFLAFFAHKYFKNELEAGTPFTMEGGKEMFRLGILGIAIPLGTDIVAGIIGGIMEAVLDVKDAFNGTIEVSIGLGIMFLVLSVIFKYGACVEERK